MNYKIPENVFFSEELSSTAKLLYAYILKNSKNNLFTISNIKIASVFKLDVKHISSLTITLENCGLIKIHRPMQSKRIIEII